MEGECFSRGGFQMIRWLTVPVVAGLLLVFTGCKDRDRTDERTVAEETEVDEGLFGGTEIEKKEVIEKNGKYEVREQETQLDDEGRVQEQETEVKPPREDADVDVRVGEGGVDVDVRARDKD